MVKAVLKPGKDETLPESYRPISLLCVGYKLLERLIYNRIVDLVDAVVPTEQAGFRAERNCCDQVLSLTTFIEAGFDDKLKTTVVFMDLSAAYDTVWKQGLLLKLTKVLKCRSLINLINEMLSNRSFVLHFGTKSSRRRQLNNGLPQGSVLAPLFFNLYTSDIPATSSRKFIYADDLALGLQYKYNTHGEKEASSIIEGDLQLLDKYYSEWRLRPNPNKCSVLTCHLSNSTANSQIKINFRGVPLKYNTSPKYLGVILDRSLTYKQHCHGLRGKIKSRNNIIMKLAGSTWGASADVLRISALSLVYSAAEYCAPVWNDSVHSKLIDVQLNHTMRIIAGVLRSTELPWLPILSNIAPARLRREAALAREASKILLNTELQIHMDLENRTTSNNRLISRRPLWSRIENLDDILCYSIDDKWKELFDAAEFTNKPLISSPNVEMPGFRETRRRWVTCNRIRTNVGICNHTLNLWYPDMYSSTCDCGDPNQTIEHIVNTCPLRRFEGDFSELHQLTARSILWIDNLDINL